MRRPTLKDVARELQVSESYVSKVLSGHQGTFGANPARREAVLARAQAMGFKKNRNAAALALGKNATLAVFVHHLGVRGSDIAEDMIRGIAVAATAAEQRLWLTFFEKPEEFVHLCPAVDTHEVDGLIVGGCSHPELTGALVMRIAAGVPVVTIHDQQLDPRLLNVGCDQAEVGAMAAQHLLERGCRRLATLGPALDREQGTRGAVAAAGLALDERLCRRVPDFCYETGVAAMTELLAAGVPFDGISAHSDQLAVAALHVLLAAGKRVPEDVRIIGVDNSPFCDFTVVPLSSISQGYEERGRRAVRLLLGQAQGIPSVSTRVSAVVVARRSTM